LAAPCQIGPVYHVSPDKSIRLDSSPAGEEPPEMHAVLRSARAENLRIRRKGDESSNSTARQRHAAQITKELLAKRALRMAGGVNKQYGCAGETPPRSCLH